jgi:hypothetical protein
VLALGIGGRSEEIDRALDEGIFHEPTTGQESGQVWSDERRQLVGTSSMGAVYRANCAWANDRPAGSLDHSSKSSVQDRFRGTQPILQIDDKTSSSDLPVGRSGASRREGEERDVIASEAKQSMLSLWRDGLLRFARNDGSTNELPLVV